MYISYTSATSIRLKGPISSRLPFSLVTRPFSYETIRESLSLYNLINFGIEPISIRRVRGKIKIKQGTVFDILRGGSVDVSVTKSIRSGFRDRWPFPTLLRIIFYWSPIDQPSVYFRPSRQTEVLLKRFIPLRARPKTELSANIDLSANDRNASPSRFVVYLNNKLIFTDKKQDY